MSHHHALALRRALVAGGVLAVTLAAHAFANPDVGMTAGAPFVWAQIVLVATLLGSRSRWRVRGFTRCLGLLVGLQFAAHATITVAPWVFGLAAHHQATFGLASVLVHLGAAVALAGLIARVERLLDFAVRVARALARALRRGRPATPQVVSLLIAPVVRPRALHLRRLASVHGPPLRRTFNRSASMEETHVFTSRSRPHRRAFAVATTALAFVAAPALGHTDLVKSSPAQGAVVRVLPGTVTLTFGEPIAKARSVTVTRSGTSHLVTFGRNPKNAAQVRVRTKNDREGRYTMAWKVVGNDGHTITGVVRFRVSR